MNDAERQFLRPALPHRHQGRERMQDRSVMYGVLFESGTGTPWRDLPERCGPYTTRRDRRSRNGAYSPTMETLRMHAGDDDGIGKAATELPTPGHVAGCTQAEAFPADLGLGGTVIGVRAIDTDSVPGPVGRADAAAAVPSKSSRTSLRPLDRRVCATCNIGECLLDGIKEFRRVTTRLGRTARNLLSAMHLAADRCAQRKCADRLLESAAGFAGTAATVCGLAAMAGDAAAQTAACSNEPSTGERVECTEDATSSDDIDILL